MGDLPPAYGATPMPVGAPQPPIAEPLTYGYTPVFDAAPATIRSFGIDELKPEEHVPDKFEIIGTDMQLLRLHMEPGEMVVAEPGAMIYMSENVTAGCNSDDCWGRCVSCSPCIMATFEAEAADTYIALTPVRPAKVLPVPLKGRRFLAKDRAFFASLGQVEVNFDVDTNLLTCCCGGQGLIRQVLKGNGMVFMGAMGVITHKVLQPGETLLVDTNSLVAWEDSVEFGVESTGGLKNCCCAGEGLFNTKLVGPGTVFLQSYSHGKFAQYAVGYYLGNRALGGNAALFESGGAAYGGGPSAAEDNVELQMKGEVIPPGEVRRRGLPLGAVAPAPMPAMDRKAI